MTIHKQRRQFFLIFDTPFPMLAVFQFYPSAILTNFDPFPPPNCLRRLWKGLKIWLFGMETGDSSKCDPQTPCFKPIT